MPRIGTNVHGAALLALLVLFSVMLPASSAKADGVNWMLRAVGTDAADEAWESVAYGDGLWVAVASSGAIMTSSDAIDWTSRTAPTSIEWKSVAYGNGLWVAVANDRTETDVMTSRDGIVWTSRTDGSSILWSEVAFGRDGDGDPLWVAVAANNISANNVMTSADGQSWTVRTLSSQGKWRSVAYGRDAAGDPLWVAVSDTDVGAVGQRVMTSSDGESWTLRPSPRNAWHSVAFGNDAGGNPLWVAVARDGSGDRVMTSPDGVNWTLRTSAGGDTNWNSVAFGQDGSGDPLWIAVGDRDPSDPGDRVMTSPDGRTWTAQMDAADSFWTAVAYGDGGWVAVASTASGGALGARVMTSGVDVPAASAAASAPEVSCVSGAPLVGEVVSCTVTGGNAGIDILWRAAYNPVIAEAGVTLDALGSGAFSFVVPAAALGQAITVELVEWTVPVSLGVVGGPVPVSVPSGGGPAPVWLSGLVALAVLSAKRHADAASVRCARSGSQRPA